MDSLMLIELSIGHIDLFNDPIHANQVEHQDPMIRYIRMLTKLFKDIK